MKYLNWMPAEGTQILFVLFLSFLVGLEREEHRAPDDRFAFGGVRTFPLIGMIGYACALLSAGSLVLPATGFAVVGAFLLMSYRHNLGASGFAGVTTEMSGLATYLVGALIYRQSFWMATTLTVASVLLLELKVRLETLARRIDTTDVLTLAKFLLLAAVVLPLLPDASFGPFAINPFRTWLVVVAVSAVSYASYLCQRLARGRGGIVLAALLGGAYSSTVTTVVIARRSAEDDRPHLSSGATLMASGIMYLRLAALLALFNRGLLTRLGPAFLGLAALALGFGAFWSRRRESDAAAAAGNLEPRNPLELGTALLFALLFVAMLVATHLAIRFLGDAGVYSLAGIMGVTDVDPFILGLTQSAPALTPLPVAAAAILIAAASNNAIKGVYAYAWSSRRAGRESLAMLLALAALGLLPLVL
ncbi:MAG: MgtC/SapB family protein [Gammaproteobacteria bacterium]|nr:MgtC/SapB family protein [Gammaproteobacteria bacterium]